MLAYTWLTESSKLQTGVDDRETAVVTRELATLDTSFAQLRARIYDGNCATLPL